MTGSAARGGPTRTCVGCGRRDSQAVLLRLRRGEAAVLFVDASRRGKGRSAYVHGQADCVKGLLRSKGLGKSLRTTVAREARLELMESLGASMATGQTAAARSGRGPGSEA